MNDDNIEDLKSNNIDILKRTIEDFNKKNSSLFEFEEFNLNGRWKKLWNAVFEILQDKSKSSIYPECLTFVRILSRDKSNIVVNNIQSELNCLLKLANLSQDSVIVDIEPDSTETIVEALKCLCNIVFLSSQCQKLCLKNACTDGILKRVSCATSFPYDIEYFDMKLLFLITILEPLTRTKVRDDLNGMTYLTEWLDLKLKTPCRTDKQIDLICQILTVMFNITANPDKTPNGNENEIQYRRLTVVIRGILYEFGKMKNEKEINVINHVVNLITNIATVCLSELLAKKNDSHLNELLFEGKCIRALDVILEFLKISLKTSDDMNINEKIPPILTALIKCARCCPIMRHYIRSVILPPLKDVSKRPEIGDELRNHLCRFLTQPYMAIRDLSAELLFICCKENVGRMIKYTGYGNAAGLFASRGVLDCRRIENTEYSSDSEDSDTDEYKEVQQSINPVLGCYESPKRNPLDGMSEEQKEYESMQLVKLMDQLHKSGIVQPCRIGEDGKPQPVDHILQLQEELPQQQLEQRRKT